MQFGDFAGNAGVKRQLAAAFDAGHLPHALLLEGESGSGRRTLAMLLARAATCRDTAVDRRPCGSCGACIKTVHPDITNLGGDSTPLTVDVIRRVREDAFLLPNESAKRIFILAQAQTMTPQAQNALLKILEEPPAHVMFILTCDSRVQLLETIRSRCLCLTLSPVPWEEAAPSLRLRLPGIAEEQLQKAHAVFGGFVGRVIAGVSDGTMTRVLDVVPALAAAVADPFELPLMQLLGKLEKDKELTAGALAELQLVFRDALVLRCGSTHLLSTAPDQARLLAQRFTGTRLNALIQQTERLRQDLQNNMNNTLLLTRLCACLRQAAGY